MLYITGSQQKEWGLIEQQVYADEDYGEADTAPRLRDDKEKESMATVL